MATVRLDADGFVVIRVYAGNRTTGEQTRMLYKVDSGANTSTISKRWLYKLGYDDDWIKSGIKLEGDDRPVCATGDPINDCFRVVLPVIRVGLWVGRNWPFRVRLNNDGENEQFRLLFGTDSMQFFNWIIDYEKHECQYEAIRGKKIKLIDGNEKSIHEVTGATNNEIIPTAANSLSVPESLSDDAQMMYKIIREVGYIKETQEYNKKTFSTPISNISKAIQELVEADLVTLSSEAYVLK